MKNTEVEKMKRKDTLNLILILTLIMALAITGCGASPAEATATNTVYDSTVIADPKANVVLSVADVTYENVFAALQKRAAEYEAEEWDGHYIYERGVDAQVDGDGVLVVSGGDYTFEVVPGATLIDTSVNGLRKAYEDGEGWVSNSNRVVHETTTEWVLFRDYYSSDKYKYTPKRGYPFSEMNSSDEYMYVWSVDYSQRFAVHKATGWLSADDYVRKTHDAYVTVFGAQVYDGPAFDTKKMAEMIRKGEWAADRPVWCVADNRVARLTERGIAICHPQDPFPYMLPYMLCDTGMFPAAGDDTIRPSCGFYDELRGLTYVMSRTGFDVYKLDGTKVFHAQPEVGKKESDFWVFPSTSGALVYGGGGTVYEYDADADVLRELLCNVVSAYGTSECYRDNIAYTHVAVWFADGGRAEFYVRAARDVAAE